MSKKKGNVVFSNFIWRFAERCGAKLVSFVVSVVLARMLDQKVYGTVALLTVFITILQLFVDSGLGNALIQKKDADEVDFSTVFYTNILFCIVLYVILYVSSPLISKFYNDSSLTSLIRVLGLTVLVSGVKNVQQAYVSRNMLFRKFFFSTLGGTIVAAILGIATAMMGYGVWALVIQQVVNVFIDTLILWLTVKWRPQKVFSITRLKELFSYGWKLLASSLLDTGYNNLRQLIIGKMYSQESLAYYERGRQFPDLIVSNINISIDSVLLPAMSNVQDASDSVKKMTRRSLKISTYIMAPLMMGLCAVSGSVVGLILTDKWLPCVPFLRIFCIIYMFYPIHTANLNAIKAVGRSDLYLKLEIIKKLLGIALLLATMKHGTMAMAYSLLANSIISLVINAWPNKKLLNYGYLEQMKDVLPSFIIAICMGGLVWSVELIKMPVFVTLVVQVFVGAVFYIGCSVLFKLDSFNYMWDIISGMQKDKRRKHG